MNHEELFTIALGFADSLYVRKTDFDHATEKFYLQLNFLTRHSLFLHKLWFKGATDTRYIREN